MHRSRQASNNTMAAGVKAHLADEKPKPSTFVPPKFTPLQDARDALNYLMWDPYALTITLPILFLLESVAMKVIQKKVSYTEIDYTAYMEQIWTIKNGERDYSRIEGGTGPLVYPAGHVLIYRAMEKITDGLNDISQGQNAFRFLYLLTLGLQFACYWFLQIPSAYAVFAVLSKRLHSIYVLRLFNDCFTTLLMVTTVFWFLVGAKYKWRWTLFLSALSYTMAVSVKMNALLYLPGVLLSLFILSDGRLLDMVACGLVMLGWQLLVALPFLREHPVQYLHGAFDFSRQFMYRWSVNWQMLDEEIFRDPLFHRTLLLGHLVVLSTFALCRYLPQKMSRTVDVLRQTFCHPLTRNGQGALAPCASPKSVAYILFTSNYIGILFARSLHYQFLAWYHWTLPVLLAWSGMPYPLALLWYALHEWTWASYPPSAAASLVLHLCNSTLLVLVFLYDARDTPRDDDKKNV